MEKTRELTFNGYFQMAFGALSTQQTGGKIGFTQQRCAVIQTHRFDVVIQVIGMSVFVSNLNGDRKGSVFLGIVRTMKGNFEQTQPKTLFETKPPPPPGSEIFIHKIIHFMELTVA